MKKEYIRAKNSLIVKWKRKNKRPRPCSDFREEKYGIEGVTDTIWKKNLACAIISESIQI
jgi:hypothetical protein